MGKSAAGKDTLANKLCEARPWTNKVVQCTTRPPRDYEKDGVNYNFLSERQFFDKIHNEDIIEYTVFRGWFYGTDKSLIKDDCINIIVHNPQGYLNLMQAAEKDPNLVVMGVYVQASDKIRVLRSLEREEHPDVGEVCRRFLADKEDFDFLDRDERPEVLRLKNDTLYQQLQNVECLCDIMAEYR